MDIFLKALDGQITTEEWRTFFKSKAGGGRSFYSR
jgi:hypothetical protein